MGADYPLLSSAVAEAGRALKDHRLVVEGIVSRYPVAGFSGKFWFLENGLEASPAVQR